MLNYFKSICLKNIDNISIYQYKDQTYLNYNDKLKYLNMLVFNLKKDYYKYVFNIDFIKNNINIDIYQIKSNKFNKIKDPKIILNIELDLNDQDPLVFINILKDLKDIKLNDHLFNTNFNYSIINIK